MAKFSDIKMQPHPVFMPGVQGKIFFPNGYGASVIKGKGSYGYEQGLYELAVLKGDETSFDLCYTTPLTDDVIGRVSEDEVTALLERIEALDKSDD